MNIDSLRNAIYIEERLGKNWFNIDRFIKKTAIKDRDSAAVIIGDLVLRGALLSKVSELKKNKGEYLYKINGDKVMELGKVS